MKISKSHVLAQQREINEETGLKVEIHDPVEEWSFYKTPDQLIKGITLECEYLDGKVKLCGYLLTSLP